MVKATVGEANPPEDDRVRSFRTHDGYLRAIEELALGDEWGTVAEKLSDLAVRAGPRLPSATRKASMSDEVRACLHRAWGTELLLATTQRYTNDTEVIRLANSWAAVQAYYAHYGVVQALIVITGGRRPEQHEATQKQFAVQWVDRSFDLLPWSLGLGSAGGRHADPLGFRGSPPGGVAPDSVHAWSYNRSTDDAVHVLGKALRGTRRDKLDEGIDRRRREKAALEKKAWKAEEVGRVAAGKKPRKEPEWKEKKNLTRDEKAAVDQSVRVVTLLDYLYRLRIKANYADAAMYDQGPETDTDARQFMAMLNSITAASMLVHELRLARLLPAGVLAREMNSWAARNDPEGVSTLTSRAELVSAHG